MQWWAKTHIFHVSTTATASLIVTNVQLTDFEANITPFGVRKIPDPIMVPTISPTPFPTVSSRFNFTLSSSSTTPGGVFAPEWLLSPDWWPSRAISARILQVQFENRLRIDVTIGDRESVSNRLVNTDSLKPLERFVYTRCFQVLSGYQIFQRVRC